MSGSSSLPARAFRMRRAAFALTTVSLTVLQFACSDASATELPPGVVTSVLVEPQLNTLKVGEQVSYSARMLDSHGVPIEGRYATWSTTDESVAIVSYDGLVSAIAPGTVSIRAVVGDAMGVITLNVSARRVASFEINPGQVTLFEGESRAMLPTARDSAGFLITGREVLWRSSDNSVVTVNAVGELTAVRPGSAVVVGDLEGHTASVTVNVGPAPVESVSITPSPLVLEVGQQRQLLAVLRDPLGRILEGRSILWTTNNGLVSITQDGVITGISGGSVTIIATSEGVSGMLTATIIAPEP